MHGAARTTCAEGRGERFAVANAGVGRAGEVTDWSAGAVIGWTVAEGIVGGVADVIQAGRVMARPRPTGALSMRCMVGVNENPRASYVHFEVDPFRFLDWSFQRSYY